MLSQLYWLGLAYETREKLAQELGIRKSAGAEVFGEKVICDGRSQEDLARVTVEQLQNFTGSTMDDFYKLFDLAVAKVERREEKIQEVVGEKEESEEGESERADLAPTPVIVSEKHEKLVKEILEAAPSKKTKSKTKK